MNPGDSRGGRGQKGTPQGTFSSRTSSESVEAGFSMATRHSICSRWFCITSLRREAQGGSALRPGPEAQGGLSSSDRALQQQARTLAS